MRPSLNHVLFNLQNQSKYSVRFQHMCILAISTSCQVLPLSGIKRQFVSERCDQKKLRLERLLDEWVNRCGVHQSICTGEMKANHHHNMCLKCTRRESAEVAYSRQTRTAVSIEKASQLSKDPRTGLRISDSCAR